VCLACLPVAAAVSVCAARRAGGRHAASRRHLRHQGLQEVSSEVVASYLCRICQDSANASLVDDERFGGPWTAPCLPDQVAAWSTSCFARHHLQLHLDAYVAVRQTWLSLLIPPPSPTALSVEPNLGATRVVESPREEVGRLPPQDGWGGATPVREGDLASYVYIGQSESGKIIGKQA